MDFGFMEDLWRNLKWPVMKRVDLCPMTDPTRWCPSSLAKLVNITPMSLWFMVDITIVNGVYKPTNITGGHHPV